MTRTVTKSDYDSGDRGFYTIIEPKAWVGLGEKNFNNKVVAKVRLILNEMDIDRYMVTKFYVHYLNDHSIKVYGVGQKLNKKEDKENADSSNQ